MNNNFANLIFVIFKCPSLWKSWRKVKTFFLRENVISTVEILLTFFACINPRRIGRGTNFSCIRANIASRRMPFSFCSTFHIAVRWVPFGIALNPLELISSGIQISRVEENFRIRRSDSVAFGALCFSAFNVSGNPFRVVRFDWNRSFGKNVRFLAVGFRQLVFANGFFLHVKMFEWCWNESSTV